MSEQEATQAAEAIRKMNAQQPITGGNSVPWFMTSLVRDKEEVTKKIDKPVRGEDQVLAELQSTDAWKFLKRFINNRRELYKELLKNKAAASPYDMQEIGFRFLVHAQVDDVLAEIINRVENFAVLVKKPEEPKGDEAKENVSNEQSK
jgi:hypothetical protein